MLTCAWGEELGGIEEDGEQCVRIDTGDPSVSLGTLDDTVGVIISKQVTELTDESYSLTWVAAFVKFADAVVDIDHLCGGCERLIGRDS